MNEHWNLFFQMPVQKSHSASLDIIESELNSVLEQDQRYWRENDAKFRAVAQNASYEQFEEIVKASHLKPLDKSDKTGASKTKTSIWNSIANATSRKSLNEDKKMEQSSSRAVGELKNLDDFYDTWKRIELCDRIAFLNNLGLDKLKMIFVKEVPSELIAEFLYSFLTFSSSSSEIVLVVNILELLTETKRFNLNIQFLSGVEKQAGQQLIEKLQAGLIDRQQDLAELGVTEWNIENIKNKFKF